MIQSFSYPEMYHAVPESSLSPRMDRYLECEVPSPSQWSDPCRSPPSLHSPIHFAADLEKLKEEPFSPPSTVLSSSSFSPSSLSSFSPSPYSSSAYSPLQASSLLQQLQRPMSREGLETSINLAELLEENAALVTHVQQQHQQYLLQQQQTSSGDLKLDGDALLGRHFLIDLVDVKKEVVDASDTSGVYHVSSTSISPPGVSDASGSSSVCGLPQPQSSSIVSHHLHQGGTVGDGLHTVHLMALDHCRQDVEMVSFKLGIPKDPTAWSSADVRSWLEYEAQQQRLPPPIPHGDTWNRTGLDLSVLTESQFKKLIPHGGELLYAKLEIWREAIRALYQQAEPMLQLQHLRSPLTSTASLQTLYTQQQSIVVTQASPPTTQPLSVYIQPHGGLPLYQQQQQQHVPQMYQSPSSSSSFSPPTLMMSPAAAPPAPVIQISSPASSPRHYHQQVSSLVPPSPLQVPTTVIHAERQQQQQQQRQDAPPKSPLLKQQQQQQQRPSSSPSATAGTNKAAQQQPSPTQQQQQQQIRNTFMEKCIDMTTLLQPGATTTLDTPEAHLTSHGETTASQQAQQQQQMETTAPAESEDEAEKESTSTAATGNRGGTHIHLWQFLKELLLHPQLYGSYIRWLDRSKGVFKIEDSVRVARLWGKRKNRPAMNYDKLSRSIRQYYKKGIMKKTERSQRLVYQFCHPYGL